MRERSFNILLVTILLTSIYTIFIFSAPTAFAQATIIYQPLAPINGFIDRTIVLGKEDSLAPYLNQIVRILIAAATGLAVIVIVYGAIQYTLTDSVTSKGEAKSTIMRAIYGLILALTSYLILNTLNPAMLSGKIRGLQEQKVAAVESGGGFGTTPDQGVVAIPDNTSTSGGTKAIYPGDPAYPYQPEDPRYGSAVYAANVKTGNNFDLQQTSLGRSITPGRVAIDTDGTERPPFNDPDWQGQTSLAGLNANTDYYVVVPIGSDIKLGTKVVVKNNTTGKSIEAVVGDRGPTGNGFGELSLAAARELGAWTTKNGNSAEQHNITYTFLED